MLRHHIMRLNTNSAFSSQPAKIIISTLPELTKPELTILLNKIKTYLHLAVSNISICPICNGSGKISNLLMAKLKIPDCSFCKRCNGTGILS
tara:strand:+ start:303 stop:578 length:276 start_codon:yes stop_codon:yes gene_type:complete